MVLLNTTLLGSFVNDELKANSQYLGQMVAVRGNIRAIEANDKN